MQRHPLYSNWCNMKSRCTNPNNPSFKDYGDRGITVCDRWVSSFKNFKEDMYPSYEDGLTLDRIDNEKGYSPSNCRWTDRKEQAINRRNTHFFDFRGKSMTLTDWASELGVNRSTLANRYYVLGWTLEETLTQ